MKLFRGAKLSEIISDGERIQRLWEHLMQWGGRMGCHQMPERSFFWHDRQFPVCARCTGVALASVILLPFFYLWRMPVYMACLLCLVILTDWGLQYLGICESTNVRRLVTGFLGGLGVGVIELHILVWMIRLTIKILT